MILRPPPPTRTATPFPCTTLFRSGHRLQPSLGNVDRRLAVIGEQPLEDLVEHLVEAVEQPLVLHIDGAREVIELLGTAVDHLAVRSEEHTSELQSLMRNSYAVFCLK